MKSPSKSLAGASILSAFVASLCCITPILAVISGATGLAASFAWLDSFRPFLIILTCMILAWAWYRALRPRTKAEIECACDENPSFIQSKKFLGIVTIFSVLLLVFPNYAQIIAPSPAAKEIILVSADDIQSLTWSIKGMTCDGCEIAVENEVNKLPGILAVDAIYAESAVNVKFDQTKTNSKSIVEAISKTGYQVLGKK
ncbi:mercuric transport protein MerTP [Algoriphagus sp.]|uniref:mercuric transport protein MerTP n=1 Tax=Algoriphagus sp. TaxID=1872435 RepID=UPI0039199345